MVIKKIWSIPGLLCCCIILVVCYIVVFMLTTAHIQTTPWHYTNRGRTSTKSHIASVTNNNIAGKSEKYQSPPAVPSFHVADKNTSPKVYINRALEINITKSLVSMVEKNGIHQWGNKNHSNNQPEDHIIIIKENVENIAAKVQIKEAVFGNFWYADVDRPAELKTPLAHRENPLLQNNEAKSDRETSSPPQNLKQSVNMFEKSAKASFTKLSNSTSQRKLDKLVNGESNTPANQKKTVILENKQNHKSYGIGDKLATNKKKTPNDENQRNVRQANLLGVFQNPMQNDPDISTGSQSNNTNNMTVTVNTSVQSENEILEITTNLKDYSKPLYNRAVNIAKRCTSCSEKSESNGLPGELPNRGREWGDSLVVCGSTTQVLDPFVVMITSIYYHPGKQYIFNNTLSNWVLLAPDLVPVLYLSGVEVLHAAGQLVYRACQLGWVVAYTPCNNSNGYPVLTSMLQHTVAIFPKAQWIGFSNGDILFTSDLLQTVRHFSSSTWVPQILLARRWNIYLNSGVSLYTLDHVTTMKLIAKQHPVTGIDLFVFNRQTFPFHVIPPMVIGRPAFDNWLVYYSTQNSLSVIDVTKTVTCLHQGIAGISLADNGHSHKTEDLTYNMKYIAQNNLRQGFIDCVRTFSRYTAGNDKNTIPYENQEQILKLKNDNDGRLSLGDDIILNMVAWTSHSLVKLERQEEAVMVIGTASRVLGRGCVRRPTQLHPPIRRSHRDWADVMFHRHRPDMMMGGGVGGIEGDDVGMVPHAVALAVLLISCGILLASLVTCCFYPD